MPIITFHGEDSVEAIVDRVYLDLSEPARRKAVAALIRANPGLRHIDGLERGAVLRVPDVPGARRIPGRHGENPQDDIARDLAGKMDDYARVLRERFEAHEKEMADQERLLGTDQLGRMLVNFPEAGKLADEAVEAVAREAEAAKDMRSRFEKAVEKLGEDLRNR